MFKIKAMFAASPSELRALRAAGGSAYDELIECGAGHMGRGA